MANEISIGISAVIANGQFKERFAPGTKKYTMSTPLSAAGTEVCSSNTTTIDLANVAAQAGWGFFTNLSTAMDILVGPTTTPWLRFPPESSHVLHFIAAPTIVVQTTANTANLQYLILST
jgi:hypothetical protein